MFKMPPMRTPCIASTTEDDDAILATIYAVFLPPKLPQSGDHPDCIAHEDFLLDRVIKALHEFLPYVDRNAKYAVESAQRAISRLRNMRDDAGHVNEDVLAGMLGELNDKCMS